MSNMSYCRFRNTYGDLLECEDYISETVLEDDESEYSKTDSEYLEEKARLKLIALCHRIAAANPITSEEN